GTGGAAQPGRGAREGLPRTGDRCDQARAGDRTNGARTREDRPGRVAGFRRTDEETGTKCRTRDAGEPRHPRAARGTDLSAYFDSSVITKWYLPEPDSAAALRVRARHEPPAVLTHLHRVELTTAWHLKVFRRELRLETVVQALADLEHDVEAGVWEPPA